MLMKLKWQFRKIRTKRNNRMEGVLPPDPKIICRARSKFVVDEHTALRLRHQDYVSRISNEVAASSIETCRFIIDQLHFMQALKAADLGSGFSSYVLRSENLGSAANHALKVYSCDTNAFWLEKTRAFLAETGCNSDGLMLWDDFITIGIADLDLVFHDLGSPDTRGKTLPEALRLCRKGGILIVDDVHKPVVRQAVLSETRKRGLQCYDLIDRTMDQFGRYAWAIVA
jgi:predicted O-methyltransferase YrrM